MIDSPVLPGLAGGKWLFFMSFVTPKQELASGGAASSFGST